MATRIVFLLQGKKSCVKKAKKSSCGKKKNVTISRKHFSRHQKIFSMSDPFLEKDLNPRKVAFARPVWWAVSRS